MAKVKAPRTCERLIVLMAKCGDGWVCSPNQIQTDLQYDCMYRISTELWRAKKRGAIIKTHRDGRNVVGYELMNVQEMREWIAARGFDAETFTKVESNPKSVQPKAPKAATPKVPKVAKAPKVAKVKPAKVVEIPQFEEDSLETAMSNMVSVSGPIDILDEIDTDVTDYEDRQYAEEYVATT